MAFLGYIDPAVRKASPEDRSWSEREMCWMRFRCDSRECEEFAEYISFGIRPDSGCLRSWAHCKAHAMMFIEQLKIHPATLPLSLQLALVEKAAKAKGAERRKRGRKGQSPKCDQGVPCGAGEVGESDEAPH